MGVVYKADDLKLGRTVALKFLSPRLLGEPEHKARFLREARVVAALDHPNIAGIHEIDEVEGQVFLSLAFVEGVSLDKKIKQRPLKLDEALDLAIQAAQGLQAAHEMGVVHRDIKSANLLVTDQGRLKVLDFGLSRSEDRTRITKSGVLMGTPAYMSPEQAMGQPVDQRTDIWSLGVVIYEMVSGRLPFQADTDLVVLYNILNEEHEPLTAMRAGLPLELDRLLAKALAKDVDKRYQHVDELLVDLRRLHGDSNSKSAERPREELRTRASEDPAALASRALQTRPGAADIPRRRGPAIAAAAGWRRSSRRATSISKAVRR